MSYTYSYLKVRSSPHLLRPISILIFVCDFIHNDNAKHWRRTKTLKGTAELKRKILMRMKL